MNEHFKRSKPFAGRASGPGMGRERARASAPRRVTFAGNVRQINFESTLERDYD
jgi:hypothetical protein